MPHWLVSSVDESLTRHDVLVRNVCYPDRRNATLRSKITHLLTWFHVRGAGPACRTGPPNKKKYLLQLSETIARWSWPGTHGDWTDGAHGPDEDAEFAAVKLDAEGN